MIVKAYCGLRTRHPHRSSDTLSTALHLAPRLSNYPALSDAMMAPLFQRYRSSTFNIVRVRTTQAGFVVIYRATSVTFALPSAAVSAWSPTARPC